MALTPIISLVLKGNLKNKKLTLKYPICQFQKGVWQIAIDSLSYEFQNATIENFPQIFCCLKCNWIRGINYNLNNELISESPFLFQFLTSKPKDCIINNKTWFEINSLTEFLTFEFYNLSSNDLVLDDCSVNLLILIQRKF